jgi:hypothetical protein
MFQGSTQALTHGKGGKRVNQSKTEAAPLLASSLRALASPICAVRAAPPAWGPPWWGPSPSREDEKQALTDYIAALKEEIEDAEAHLKELEGAE